MGGSVALAVTGNVATGGAGAGIFLRFPVFVVETAVQAALYAVHRVAGLRGRPAGILIWRSES